MINRSIKTIFAVCRLIRLYSPTGWILLGLPGSWLLLQNHVPLRVWVLWWGGAFLARSVGCVINDWLDRDIDRHVQRTQDRPFACGALGYPAFIILTGILGSLALSVAYLINYRVLIACFYITPWICLYPLAKRWLIIPQIFLAPVFAYSVIVAQIIAPHQDGHLWYLATCFWILGYDTAYAISDQKDDIKLGIYSAPLTLKKYTHAFIMFCYAYFIASILYLLPPQNAAQGLVSILLCTILSAQVLFLNMFTAQKAFHSNILVGLCVSLRIMLR